MRVLPVSFFLVNLKTLEIKLKLEETIEASSTNNFYYLPLLCPLGDYFTLNVIHHAGFRVTFQNKRKNKRHSTMLNSGKSAFISVVIYQNLVL